MTVLTLPVRTGRAARAPASPLARAIARRAGIDLSALQGSGPHGRVVKADVAAFESAAISETASGPMAYDEIANPIGRKLLARRLTESMQQAPHFYARIDCNMEQVLRLRAQAGQGATRPSINDYVIGAAALALREVPAVNVSYTDAAIRRYRHVHIAMAVALDQGLLTPVIQDADRKSVAQIAASTRDLAERARSGTLTPGECKGGTFSISNLGALGVREFTAVINPPQAAILAVGAAEPRAVVRDGMLAAATMMTVTLSCDHRAIDGALAARWLAAFKKHMENPRKNAT